MNQRMKIIKALAASAILVAAGIFSGCFPFLDQESYERAKATPTPPPNLGQSYARLMDEVVVDVAGILYFYEDEVFARIDGDSVIEIHEFAEPIVDIEPALGGGVLVCEGPRLWLYASSMLLLFESTLDLYACFSIGRFAVIQSGGEKICLDLVTREVTDSESLFGAGRQHAVDGRRGRIFYATEHVSPPGIYFIDLDLETGAFVYNAHAWNHGYSDFMGPIRLFPDGMRLIQGDGRVFDTSDRLNCLGNAQLPAADFLFHGGSLFVLTADRLLRIRPAAPWDIESVIFEFSTTPMQLVLRGDEVLVVTRRSNITFIRAFGPEELGTASASPPAPVIVQDGLVVNRLLTDATVGGTAPSTRPGGRPSGGYGGMPMRCSGISTKRWFAC